MWLDMSLRSTVMGTGRLISVGKPGWKMAAISAELALWQTEPWNVSLIHFALQPVALTFPLCGTPWPPNNQGAWVGSQATGVSGVHDVNFS